MKKYESIVLFHNNCLDGLFSAFALNIKYGDLAYYIGVSHNPLLEEEDPVETLKIIFNDKLSNHTYNKELIDYIKDDYSDKTLYIVDFCLTARQLINLSPLFKNIVVIDHHKSAIERIVGNGEFIEITSDSRFYERLFTYDNVSFFYSEKKSGAVLTYEYLFPGGSVPYEFRLIQDRDLWTWKLEETKFFTTGLFEGGYLKNGKDTFRKLDDDTYLPDDRAAICELGEKFELRKEREIQRTLKANLIEIELESTNLNSMIGFINVSDLSIISDLGNLIVNDYELNLPICILYTLQKDNRVLFSIRSREGVSSKFISESFGGGGHDYANGCQIDYMTFLDILLTRKLKVN